MAEFVVVYDSVVGGFLAKQAGSTHIADAAIVSGKLGAGSVISGAIASGQIAGAHIAAQGILSANIAPGAIAGAHLGTTDQWAARTFSGTITLASGKLLGFGTVRIREWVAGYGAPALVLENDAHTISYRLIGEKAWFTDFRADTSLGVGVNSPGVAGRIAVAEFVDGVDVSAHTHTAGAGDAPGITSAGILSGILGGVHLANQSLISANIATNILATPHIQNQGILSASFGAAAIGTPHLANQAIVSALVGANVLATPHITNQGILSASIGANVLATPHIVNQGILSASIASGIIGPHLASGGVLSAHIGPRQVAGPHLAYGSVPEFISSFIITGSGDYSIAVPSGFIQLRLQGMIIENAAGSGELWLLTFNSLTSGDYRSTTRALGINYSTFLSSRAFWSGSVLYAGSRTMFSGSDPHINPLDANLATLTTSGWNWFNFQSRHTGTEIGNIGSVGFVNIGSLLKSPSGMSMLSGVQISVPRSYYSGSFIAMWGIRP